MPFIFRSWDSNDIALARALWWEGKSAAYISGAIGASSARVVEDVVARYKFDRRPGLKPPRKDEDALLEPLEIDGAARNIGTVREGECRWMNGPPNAETPLCGRMVERGYAWCSEHKKRAFQRVNTVAEAE